MAKDLKRNFTKEDIYKTNEYWHSTSPVMRKMYFYYYLGLSAMVYHQKRWAENKDIDSHPSSSPTNTKSVCP